MGEGDCGGAARSYHFDRSLVDQESGQEHAVGVPGGNCATDCGQGPQGAGEFGPCGLRDP
ncbi:MAG: hypothetical protein ABGY30_09320 [Acidimicrobiales bacterium]